MKWNFPFIRMMVKWSSRGISFGLGQKERCRLKRNNEDVSSLQGGISLCRVRGDPIFFFFKGNSSRTRGDVIFLFVKPFRIIGAKVKIPQLPWDDNIEMGLDFWGVSENGGEDGREECRDRERCTHTLRK